MTTLIEAVPYPVPSLILCARSAKGRSEVRGPMGWVEVSDEGKTWQVDRRTFGPRLGVEGPSMNRYVRPIGVR